MKFLLFVAVSVIALFVWSKSEVETPTMQKKIECAPVKEVIEYLSSEEHREKPAWKGYDENSRFVLMLNKETMSWTFLQYDNETACVLGVGDRGELSVNASIF